MGQRPSPERYLTASSQLAKASAQILRSEGIDPQKTSEKEQAHVILLFQSPESCPKELAAFAAKAYSQQVLVRAIRVSLVNNHHHAYSDAQLDILVYPSLKTKTTLSTGKEAIALPNHGLNLSTTIETITDFGYKIPGRYLIDSEEITPTSSTPGASRVGRVGPQVLEAAAELLARIPKRTADVGIYEMLSDSPSSQLTRKVPSGLLVTTLRPHFPAIAA